MENINGYSLIREWYNFKFENPSKCKSVHSDFYCYIIDLWNRLGQKKEFGLPTSVTMECLGIGSYNTYKNTLNDLVNFGFIKIVSDAKNQYQSKVIAISKNDKASDKALDKANIKASDKASVKATDTIIEQVNKETKKQIIIPTFEEFFEYCKSKYIEEGKNPENFKTGWKRKYDSWVVNGWKDGYNNEIKNWKSKALNSMEHIKAEEPEKPKYYEMPL
jgi:hypothetical protein